MVRLSGLTKQDYIARRLQQEESAAQNLSTILRQPALMSAVLPYELSVNGHALCAEQRAAVELALSSRLSIILGGAGSGKSTLIRAIVNESGKLVLNTDHHESFRDGDRVIILKNDRERNCSNGFLELPDGRCPAWNEIHGLELLSLAYVLTVHKSQGSEYDTILFPVSMGMHGMLSRNLFYTAISRARQRVILFGDPQAVDVAMQKCLPQRKSMLVPKTRILLERCA